ncbi:hypothetical protein DUPY_04060 [Duganella phyllosphaerae]|uniref:Uncharacterized protein n=1 Tax=Duganella phyllosphaerae TaxID=762836 RepID=A0A1E7X7C6_9BURK|nr:hypothetical protein DUPY_04060 [Duganella phyllosphaerae]
MVGAVQALVGHHQLHQLAELEIAINADVLERGVGRVERHVGRHELEPRLVGIAAAVRLVQVGAVGVAAAVVGLRILPGVVGELVVVPHGDKGEALVQRLQTRVGAVLFIQVAVVGQGIGVLGLARSGLGRAVRQGERAVAAFHCARLKIFAHGLVDVVAQVNDEVELLGGDRRHRTPVVHAPVLAGHVGKLQLRHIGGGGRRGLEAADIGAGVAGDELVEIDGAGRQATDLVAHGVVVLAEQRQVHVHHRGAGQHGVRTECSVVVGCGDQQADGAVLARRCGGHVVGAGRHGASPQQDAVGARVARGHALRELPGARDQRRAGVADYHRVIAAAAAGQARTGRHRRRNKTAPLQKPPSVHVRSASTTVLKNKG